MLIHTLLFAVLLGAPLGVVAQTPRNDTLVEFTLERQGTRPKLITSGTVTEITDATIPATTSVTRDTSYVSVRREENNTTHLIPNVVREGVEASLSNTSANRATFRLTLDQLEAIRNINGGAGSVATTHRHQVSMDIGVGENRQDVRIGGVPYRITTVYTPGDSVLAETGSAPTEKAGKDLSQHTPVQDDHASSGGKTLPQPKSVEKKSASKRKAEEKHKLTADER